MRIGMFTDSYLPDINGVVTSVVTLKRVLEAHGHEVWVVSNHPSLTITEFDFRNHEIRLPGMELKKLYGYKASSPFHNKIISTIADLNWDIIHAHSEFGVGIFGRMVARSLHIPLVSTYHTTYEDYTHYVNILQMDSIDRLAKKVVAKLSKLYGETSNAVIAPSLKTKNMLLGYGIDTPITVIPTGLELRRFAVRNAAAIQQIRTSNRIESGDTLVIFVGRIAAEKSIDMVIEAFKSLADHPEIKLMIVGDGPDREELSQLIIDLQLQDQIVMTGRREPAKIPDHYHAADIFVSASRTETQGLTYIEAMASGLPVLARRDAALRDLIYEDKNGFYFDDAAELALKIQRFAKLGVKERERLRREALEKVKEYDVSIFYQRVMEVYAGTIKRYNEEYKLTAIDYQNDIVKLTLANAVNEMDIMVSVDAFVDNGLRKGMYIDKELVGTLVTNELMVYAYRKALKYLTVKDRTSKEMADWFAKDSSLTAEQIARLMELLKAKRYIDDTRYAQTQYHRLLSQLMGVRRIKRELAQKGINPEIIAAVTEQPDDETELAISYARKLQNRIKGKSLRNKQRMIKEKLLQYGYDLTTADAAVAGLDMLEEERNEKTVLRKLAQKAKTRYNRKCSGTELRNHVFRYLMSQGFAYDDIYLIINEMEWDDE